VEAQKDVARSTDLPEGAIGDPRRGRCARSIEFHCSTGTTTGTKSALDLLTDSSATQKVGRVTVSGHLGDDMPTRKTIDSALGRTE
jgi:hypothetical protein